MNFGYQYTSRCRHPRYPGIDDSALWISTPLAAIGIEPVVATFWGNCTELHSREFPGIQLPPRGSLLSQPAWCNARPLGPISASVWCNTRPLGTLSASFWCNTRPPGPPLPPSGELVPNNTPLGIPWNCAANSWNTAGPLSWYHTRTRGPPS